MKEQDPILSLRDVSKGYGVSMGTWRKSATLHAVRSVTLDVQAGETMGLVGESGCGKSTLARLCMGLEPVDSGEILFHGRTLAQWPEKDLRRRMQMVFQDPFSSLNPRRTVGATIGEGPAVHRVGSARERKERVAALLDKVGLRPEHAGRYPHEFSGGQRQRVAVARALALEPDLVFCDEPVSALDVSIQAQVINLLKSLQKDFGLTYVFISHDLAVVSHLCTRVAVMYLGGLMELSPRKDLFEDPKHPYTRALLSAVPSRDPDRKSERVRLTGDMPSPMDPPSGCPFHPRCPEVMDICSREYPKWRPVGPGRFVSCHLY